MLKNIFIKDKKKRKIFLKNYIKKQCLKSILYNENLPLQIRWQASVLQYKLKISISKLKKRCILTNRSHSTISNFKLSRIQLRKLVSSGLISGLTKSSW